MPMSALSLHFLSVYRCFCYYSSSRLKAECDCVLEETAEGGTEGGCICEREKAVGRGGGKGGEIKRGTLEGGRDEGRRGVTRHRGRKTG